MSRTFLWVAIFILFIGSIASADTLVPLGATWKYLDDGSNQGTAWRSNSFSDSTWKSGKAQLGYGQGDESTVISYGTNSSQKYITYYFRYHFNISNKSLITGLTMSLTRNDGAVAYLNGSEFYRSNMPSGTITYQTLANGLSERTISYSFSPSRLVNGDNVVAIEVHQYSPSSTDLSFDFQLTSANNSSTIAITRGPYLQLTRPNAMTIRWRTNIASDSRILYSTNPSNLSNVKDDTNQTTEHSVTLTGLGSNTQYYYTVGSTTTSLSNRYNFYTSPNNGHPLASRFWFIGDSGANPGNLLNVSNAYQSFTGTKYTNLVLPLGDSAYDTGTDAQFQSNFFDVLAPILHSSASFPVLGEHDTAGSSSPPSSLPYFNIFTLPINAEAGGKASGTEKYYSFDYGTVHFVALDSEADDRSSSGTMLTWLKNDLSNNTKPWLIAYWHHAPHSKGDHDSDTETQMSEMRQNADKILEDYGVDLVVAGHSNSFERTMFIDGFYGTSTQFSSNYIKNSGNGRASGTGEYKKTRGSVHSGTVYVVAGNAAITGGGPLNHPAMYYSSNTMGSVVVDLDCTKLNVSYVRDNGSVADSFTIRKTDITPTVTITSPMAGTVYTAPATITINASPTDPDGIIRKVRFFENGVHIGTISSPPWTITRTNLWTKKDYTYTAYVEDDMCANSTSAPVTVSVK